MEQSCFYSPGERTIFVFYVKLALEFSTQTWTLSKSLIPQILQVDPEAQTRTMGQGS